MVVRVAKGYSLNSRKEGLLCQVCGKNIQGKCRGVDKWVILVAQERYEIAQTIGVCVYLT